MTRLPCATRKATDSSIIARFSSAQTRTTFSRCSAQRLADDRADGREAVGQDAAGRTSSAVTSRRRVMPKAAIGAVANRSRASRPKSSTSFGFDDGKPGLDEVHAEPVEGVGDAQLLGRRERQPSPCMPSRRVAS